MNNFKAIFVSVYELKKKQLNFHINFASFFVFPIFLFYFFAVLSRALSNVIVIARFKREKNES